MPDQAEAHQVETRGGHGVAWLRHCSIQVGSSYLEAYASLASPMVKRG